LSHELDFRPSGQWIRSQILGIEQDLLSAELLSNLAKKSLEANCPPDQPNAWIPRALESTLNPRTLSTVTYLLGDLASARAPRAGACSESMWLADYVGS